MPEDSGSKVFEQGVDKYLSSSMSSDGGDSRHRIDQLIVYNINFCTIHEESKTHHRRLHHQGLWIAQSSQQPYLVLHLRLSA